MNHLAHLFLSRPTPESRVGNLLGDYRRGVSLESMPVAVLRGLENHHTVDRFTDNHPLVSESRALFSPRRRRFAGIALDVLFDHFLIRHWERFNAGDRDRYLDALYRDLIRAGPWMPPAMRADTQRMVHQDRFRAYGSLENVGMALDRMARRIRFANRFDGVIEEIRHHHDALEATFLEFFPQLVAHVEIQAIEAPGRPRSVCDR